MAAPGAAIRLAAALALAAWLGASSGGPALAGEPHDSGATATYAPIPPLNTMVVHANNSRGVMSIQGGLEVADPVLMARVKASMPLLRDAWIRVLSAYALALPPGSPPDADLIGRQMQVAADQVLHKSGARVLLGTIMVN